MISLFKNIVSSENDAKKYHLRSYYEMLEIAFSKDYELNPNFLKSIQQEFNISQHEHEVIMQAITESNDNLSLNILNMLEQMELLATINNEINEDYTVEIFFVKKIVQEEFNKLSTELFRLLENMYANYEVEFDGCKNAFRYSNHDVIGLSPRIYDFMSPAIVSHLKKIHNELYHSQHNNEDNNLEIINRLLSFSNKHINIAAIVASKNYELDSEPIKKFLSEDDEDLKELLNKLILRTDEVTAYEKMAYLSKVPLFASLSFEELYNLAKKSSIEKYIKDYEIISQGDNANNLFVILSGDVEILKDGIKISELSSCDYFGEIAIVAKSKRTATVRATSDVKTIVFSEKAFNEIINTYPNISVQIMKEMTKRLLQNNS